MPRLSVNVNKVATIRNSRGGHVPSVTEAVRVCVAAGAPGITVHPRADGRHITLADVREVAAELAPLTGRVEYNIEGDPREDLMTLVCEVRADQATLVPVMPGERTSQAGWRLDTPPAHLRGVIDRLHEAGVRVSLFVDPEPSAVDWAASLGADRVELYTEPYAASWGKESFKTELARLQATAKAAASAGMKVNAGHDLDLRNLPLMARSVPEIVEVSIGHALIADALYLGFAETLRRYVRACNGEVVDVPITK
jgi:pyridoxine 5-phosphate synthase